MAVTNQSRMAPFAEKFLITSEGNDSIEFYRVNNDVLLLGCQVEVITASTGTAANLTVGAGSDADGLIVASDAAGTAGTIYGDAVADLGDDWKVATGATSGYCMMPNGVKYVAQTAFTFVLSADPTTEGVYAVTIWGFALSPD